MKGLMSFNNEKPTVSTLNGDSSDKGLQPDDLDIADSPKTVNNLDKAAEAPFHMQFEKLSRPFMYLKKINAQDQESKFKRMNGELNKNIPNSILAADLAYEIQHILICEIKHKNPAVRIRDGLITSSTRYMVQIFEQILNLFETNYNTKYDIEELFTLLIEYIYRLEGIVTPTFQESISLDDTRKILRNYKNWVIELKV